MLFKRKKRRDIIDLGELQEKKKLLISKERYKDLTNDSDSKNQQPEGTNSFFGAISNSSSSQNPINSQLHPADFNTDLQIKDFTRKIEDIEFKLDSVGRRLNSVIDRIEVVERKISRLEGRE